MAIYLAGCQKGRDDELTCVNAGPPRPRQNFIVSPMIGRSKIQCVYSTWGRLVVIGVVLITVLSGFKAELLKSADAGESSIKP
jgi:hypothetical protein